MIVGVQTPDTQFKKVQIHLNFFFLKYKIQIFLLDAQNALWYFVLKSCW